ncbi:MurR/RpiR family transcriptional regulator [Microbacterium sp.]|uniref:MurR/RpiR family transcriptional regulator n=1 Tax=Microbacterium sp. TaxID=51671 RepID=UPI00333FB006
MHRSDAGPIARIATVLNSLQPTERRVAEAILQAPDEVVELTAQQLADRVGVGRSSVIRACQSFGYRGFPQLRVALAGTLGQQEPALDYGQGVVGRMRAEIDRVAQSLPQAVSMLDEEAVERVVREVARARRVLIVANGLSAPIASDLSMRLTAVGRPAETVPDAIAQQIAASGLASGDVCLVVSGSGANESSLRAASAARGSALIVALTSFAASALTALADLSVVIAPAGVSFRDELEHTSRVAHAVFVEVFVGAVAHELGDEGTRRVRDRVLGILSDNLADDE